MMDVVLEKLQRVWFSARHGRRFHHVGRKSFVVSPWRFDGVDGIALGDEVFIQRGAWLYCCGVDGQRASLTIGTGAVLGYNNHITAVHSVTIGEHVLTANNVYVSDNVHAYEDVRVPIMHQPVKVKQAVSVGAGSWLGENVCIVGANVGRNCVIGANAVVTRDIPDYSVAVGIPARVIRWFDPEREMWINGAPT